MAGYTITKWRDRYAMGRMGEIAVVPDKVGWCEQNEQIAKEASPLEGDQTKKSYEQNTEQIYEQIASKTPETPQNSPQRAFLPGFPYFRSIAPNTWVETEWAKRLCVFCTTPLAEGDPTCCEAHRRAMEAVDADS